MSFKKATKLNSKLRCAIDGPSGAGKTYTSLKLGIALCPPGKRVRVIDTERGSASKYADRFDFDVLELTAPYSIERYIEAIRQGSSDPETGVLLIDSLSHAWSGEGGALEKVDQEKVKSKNDFTAWRSVTPLHNKLVESILSAPCHVIATMRTKIEYVLEPNEKGRIVPKKVGTKPIQREGLEYEFDVIMDMDIENNGIVTKSRCSDLSGNVYKKPGDDVAAILQRWLTDGAPVPAPAVSPTFVAANQAIEAKAMLEKSVGFVEMSAAEKMLIAISEAQSKEDLTKLIPRIQELNLTKDGAVREAYGARDAELR
jgi:hypothetical protein